MQILEIFYIDCNIDIASINKMWFTVLSKKEIPSVYLFCSVFIFIYQSHCTFVTSTQEKTSKSLSIYLRSHRTTYLSIMCRWSHLKSFANHMDNRRSFNWNFIELIWIKRHFNKMRFIYAFYTWPWSGLLKSYHD